MKIEIYIFQILQYWKFTFLKNYNFENLHFWKITILKIFISYN